MTLARSRPGIAFLSAVLAISCGSTTPPTSTSTAGASSMTGAGNNTGGLGSGGHSDGGGAGGRPSGGSTSTSGAGGKAATGGSAMSEGGSSAGAPVGGAATAGSGTAGTGGSDLPSYAGPGVECFMGFQNDADNRCGVGQTCCEERFGRTECQPDIGSCAPCTKDGECTAISCDEPADCPGGACCATLGTGGGGVEFARLTCQPSCSEGQYVICATLADCPSEYHECGISSMLIHRCFH